MNKKVYVIGIGGIGVSAIARYYNELGYQVFGSDSTDSELISKLKSEGINIIIGTDNTRIYKTIDLVVYTEAISKDNEELKKAIDLGIKTLTYPQALGEITKNKKLIAVAGTHGKSTTSSMASLLLKNSELGVNSVVGTILKEFGNKNTHFSGSEYFVIEACEYKRAFLNYSPYITIITNIEIDHLDYYKNLDDYISAYESLLKNTRTGGYVILNGVEENSKKLIGIRDDLKYIELHNDYFIIDNKKIHFPEIKLQIPGPHILYDSRLVYCLGYILNIDSNIIIDNLEQYKGVWRRMEIVGETVSNNIVMSDYGHHPTEIKLTLNSLKSKYSNKTIITVFQPHQYNRTIELLEGFKSSFIDTDILIIPNIYESRDSEIDKKNMSTQKLLDNINHRQKINGQGLETSLKVIEDIEKDREGQCLILLLGAGDVDNLRYKMKIKKQD